MPDVRYLQKPDFNRYRISLDFLQTPANLLDESQALASAVVVAMGTDRTADESDTLPGLDETDRRGWWGDMDAEEIWGAWPVGSRLWLLERAKIAGPHSRGGSTLAMAEFYAREALHPFVDARIASRIDVRAVRTDIDRIDVYCTLYRGPLPAIELRYSELWTEETA